MMNQICKPYAQHTIKKNPFSTVGTSHERSRERPSPLMAGWCGDAYPWGGLESLAFADRTPSVPSTFINLYF